LVNVTYLVLSISGSFEVSLFSQMTGILSEYLSLILSASAFLFSITQKIRLVYQSRLHRIMIISNLFKTLKGLIWYKLKSILIKKHRKQQSQGNAINTVKSFNQIYWHWKPKFTPNRLLIVTSFALKVILINCLFCLFSMMFQCVL
jgi:hypothetical protein